MPAQLHFLGPRFPLATVAADWLVQAQLAREGQTVIIVPTARSGERLAAELKERGLDFSHILTGGEWMQRLLAASEQRIVSQLVARELMAQAIRQLREQGQCQQLFPHAGGNSISGIGSLKTADLLLDLRHALAEEGLSLENARDILLRLPDFPEVERWDDILLVEKLYIKFIRDHGLLDKEQTLLGLLAQKGSTDLPERVVLAFTPDPPPLLLKVIEQYALSCDILISAEVAQKEYFDSWGRPCPAYWCQSSLATITLEPFKERVAVAATTADAARQLLEATSGETAVGILHADLASEYESLSALDGAVTYNPAGIPVVQTGVGTLLDLLAKFLRTAAFTDSVLLMRHNDVRAWLLSKWSEVYPAEAFYWRTFLAELDAFANDHLPGSLQSAYQLAERAACSRQLLFVLDQLSVFRGSLLTCAPEDIGGFFQDIFVRSPIPRVVDPHRIEEKARATLLDMLVSLQGQATVFQTATELMQAVAAQFLRERVFYACPEGAREYQGWLELAYDPSPRLYLYGMAEGIVPSALQSSVFLPEAARRAMGLRNSDHRYARDAFLFQFLIESRKAEGEVHVGYFQRSSNGDPLKPSRLLFHCQNKQLPERAGYLFGRTEEVSRRPAWQLAWKLAPPEAERGAALERLRVTAFKEYLACPYRFYLRHILGMRPYEPNRLEMDERSFGNLMHNTFEAFGKSSECASTDMQAIAACCETHLMQQVEHLYGSKAYRNLAVDLQIESALQRLGAFARIQAEEAKQGWKIVAVEQKFELPLQVKGKTIVIRGTIDRIECRDSQGKREWRVLDYKTYDKVDKAHEPGRDHIASIGKGAPPLIGQIDEERYWKNLQLPLYIHALKGPLQEVLPIKRRPDEVVRTAYVILPKAIDATEVCPWDMTDEELSSALNCAQDVLTAVNGGQFWPPSPNPQYDEFEEILDFPDALQSVTPPNT